MDYRQLVRDLVEVSKPGIIRGNILTASAGYIYGYSGPEPWLRSLILLVLGLSLVIAGACAANNILDRRLDVHMERTRNRPLINGRLSLRVAYGYTFITTASGLLILSFSLNLLTVVLAATAWIAYVGLYGYAKRSTVHSTLVGCISGSLPIVIGYVAATDTINSTAALFLFLLMTAWQMAHFFGIALYRQTDYMAAKVPVMPVVYGARSTQLQTIGYMILYVLIIGLMAAARLLHWLPALVLGIIACGWIASALWSWSRLSSLAWGRRIFLQSLIVVMTMCVVLMTDRLF